jgi:hypothetical protein
MPKAILYFSIVTTYAAGAFRLRQPFDMLTNRGAQLLSVFVFPRGARKNEKQWIVEYHAAEHPEFIEAPSGS